MKLGKALILLAFAAGIVILTWKTQALEAANSDDSDNEGLFGGPWIDSLQTDNSQTIPLPEYKPPAGAGVGNQRQGSGTAPVQPPQSHTPVGGTGHQQSQDSTSSPVPQNGKIGPQ
eukprot:GHVT01030578.1.p1 GENE.GHVT01030578.1~~GHVT01030578.1.p1  ORF type:complete len:116 (+),score=2.68 GHVT01030578.1:48-395(+)